MSLKRLLLRHFTAISCVTKQTHKDGHLEDQDCPLMNVCLAMVTSFNVQSVQDGELSIDFPSIACAL